MRWVCVLVSVLFFVMSAPVLAEKQNCGTHWTGWVKEADSDKNPCPHPCQRGERLAERTWGKPPDMQYDFQYQCYFPDPKQTGYGDTGPASGVVQKNTATPAKATPTGQTRGDNASSNAGAFPFIRGRVDDESAPNGAWLNWETKFKPLPPNLRGKEAWLPIFETISLFIKQSPALTTMREYYPWLSYGVDHDYQPLPRAQISIILWSADWVEPAPATPDRIKLKPGAWRAAPAGIDVWINWFPTSASGASDDLKSWDWYKDSQGEFFRLAKPDRLIDGFSVHGGWLFVTAKNKPPLFVPVSQERLLKAYDQWAQRVNGMSEAERSAPAHMRVDPDALLLEDLVAPSDPAAVALMQYNPEYVNRKLGPEIPQLLVLPIGTSKDWGRRAEALAKMPVNERVPIALVERTQWSEIQSYLR
jgi:hypothetical protein